MATTYGSVNLGSSSKGGFAIYTAATTGATAVSLLKADFATNIVSKVTGAVPLTDLQSEALSTILAKLRDAVPLADTLALLRKLVGVISLTDGVIITLSTTSVGAVHTLLATPSVADKLLVYVPNSAATGLYTGSGADGSGGGATGAAGGVLGYPGSTYPDPNGLAAIANKIPIKANGITPIVIQPDADALFPSGITLSGADSSGTSAGVVEVRGGTSTGVGGAGGSALLVGGAGDTVGGSVGGTAGDSASGNGGTASLIGGNGAVDGGFANLNAGDGGLGDGGIASVTGGSGAVIGGNVVVGAGTGGTGKGGTVSITGGSSTSDVGGDITLFAGFGATVGGSVAIDAGVAPTAGDVSIGEAFAGRVFIGSGTNTLIIKRALTKRYEVQTLLIAGDILSADYDFNTIGSAGPITLSATTPIAAVTQDLLTYGGAVTREITFFNVSVASNITVPAGGNVLVPGGVNLVVAPQSSFTTVWVESLSAWVVTNVGAAVA